MRRLVAALACRVDGSRLYGKPMQNLDVKNGVSILGHMLGLIQTLSCINATVLGISEGRGNDVFVEYAERNGFPYIVGDKTDVLQRLIQCGQIMHGTDIFRVTTESPFFLFEVVENAWRSHVQHSNDVTTVDGLPEGCHFEIYTLNALNQSHERGDSRHRSEFCSLYIREHRDDFKIEVLPIPGELERLDLRLTVDHPEDLVLCRRVYEHFCDKAPRISVGEIIQFLDRNPQLKSLVQPYVVAERLW